MLASAGGLPDTLRSCVSYTVGLLNLLPRILPANLLCCFGLSNPFKFAEGRTDALPVHYVFPRRKLDLEAAKKALLDATIELADGSNKGVVIVWDVAYDWLAGEWELSTLDSITKLDGMLTMCR